MSYEMCKLYVARFIEIFGEPILISANHVSGSYDYHYSNFSFTYSLIQRLHDYEGDGWEIEFLFYDTKETTCFTDPEDFDRIVAELKAA